MTKRIPIKRVYEPYSPDDGYRILIDRLWPRGLTKEKAKIDLWLKSIAPSNELRKWFGHDPEKWSEFQKKYKAEIEANTESVSTLKKALKEQKVVTFIYSAKDELHNDAVVLQAVFSK